MEQKPGVVMGAVSSFVLTTTNAYWNSVIFLNQCFPLLLLSSCMLVSFQRIHICDFTNFLVLLLLESRFFTTTQNLIFCTYSFTHLSL